MDEDFKKYIEWFTLKVYKDTENKEKITYIMNDLVIAYKKKTGNLKFKLNKNKFIHYVKGLYLNEISYSINNDRLTIYFD